MLIMSTQRVRINAWQSAPGVWHSMVYPVDGDAPLAAYGPFATGDEAMVPADEFVAEAAELNVVDRRLDPFFYARNVGVRMVYCTHCHKTHAVRADEEECAPGAWRDDA